MERMKHIGVDSFFAMRKKLLADYEIAKQQTRDDAVQVEHGNVGESVIRNWLEEFLPKRFGVCKGYIITTNLKYDGPMEEWDIIIYDAIESPTLFTRTNGDDKKMAIPVEYVRGVIEVKANLNKVSATKAVKKLKKLEEFIGINEFPNYPKYLNQPFITSIIFFEIGVTNLNQYKETLDIISEICQDEIVPFMGALVLKSSKNPDHTGYLKATIGDAPMFEEPIFEMSNNFIYPNKKYGCFGASTAYGTNHFPEYVFDILKLLKGEYRAGYTSSFYGLDFENTTSSRLFH